MGRQLRGRGQEMVDLGEKRVQNRGTQTPSGYAARSHEGRDVKRYCLSVLPFCEGGVGGLIVWSVGNWWRWDSSPGS